MRATDVDAAGVAGQEPGQDTGLESGLESGRNVVPGIEPTAGRPARWEVLAVLALTVIGALLRIWRLGEVPPGLHVDEAYNLLDIPKVLGGQWPVFLPENAGREALFTYLQAPFVALLGPSALSGRLTSAVIGACTIPLVWAFVRRLRFARPQRVALWTAGILTGLYWHLHFSRFGIRAILFPFIVTAVAWAWWRIVSPTAASFESGPVRLARSDATAPPSRRDLALLGILLGLAAYAHPAGRALVLVPALDAGLRWGRNRDTAPIRALAAALPVALLVALPVILYWIMHPWWFTGHAQEVSILSQGPAALWANLWRVAGMFNLAGDAAPWRNLPGRPVFPASGGLFFLLGLGLTLRAAWRGADWARLALIWLVLLLVPSIASDGAPNFSRAIGVLPVACLLPAFALDSLVTWDRKVPPPWVRTALPWFAAAWIAAAGAGSAADYFDLWANDPDTPLAFDDDKVALARWMNAAGRAGAPVYLSRPVVAQGGPDLLAVADHPTVRLLAAAPPVGFDARYGLVLPDQPGTPALYAFLPNERVAIDALAGRLAQWASRPESYRREAATAVGDSGLTHPLVVFRLEDTDSIRKALEASASGGGGSRGDQSSGGTDESGPSETVSWEHPVTFAEDGRPAIQLVRVLGPPTLQPGSTVTVTLVWQTMGPTRAAMSTAVQLVDGAGHGLGQGDGMPLGGSYPTSDWSAGQIILADYALQVDADAEGGPAVLRVGWYDLANPAHVLLAADDQPVVEVARLAVAAGAP